MSEMIERVARQIYERDFWGEKAPKWSDMTEIMKQPFCVRARETIEALREEDLRAELAWRAFQRQHEKREDGCWQWLGAISKRDGYGRFYDGTGQTKSAYRYAFERERGPVPAGMVIDHLCRNRACVNPSHMRIVTNAENVLCGMGLTAMFARATECKWGHPLDEANTYVRPNGERACRACHATRSRAHKARKRALRALKP